MNSSLFHPIIPSHYNYSHFPSITNLAPQIFQILKSHSTPLFVTQKSIIDNRLQTLSNCLNKYWPHPFSIAYSFKTNYDIAKNIKFNRAEVVSTTEYKLAKHLGYPDQSIIFNGPNKSNLEALLSKPLLINLDNFSEIGIVVNYSKPIVATLGLRLNTKIHPSRFGFNIESGEAHRAFALLNDSHIPIKGTHFHMGSDIHQTNLYLRCSEIIASFIFNHRFSPLQFIDFGGGYPSHGILPGSHLQPNPNISSYLLSLTKPLIKYFSKNKPTLILEPGRYLVDDSTIFISKVLSTKKTNKLQTIVIDATNNMLPSVWYRKLLVKSLNGDLTTPKSIPTETIIFGSSCQETDIIFQGSLPTLSTNDLIICFCVGAYNQSQSSQFIFPIPKTVLL